MVLAFCYYKCFTLYVFFYFVLCCPLLSWCVNECVCNYLWLFFTWSFEIWSFIFFNCYSNICIFM
jgi:hypothetical protein